MACCSAVRGVAAIAALTLRVLAETLGVSQVYKPPLRYHVMIVVSTVCEYVHKVYAIFRYTRFT